MLIVGKNNMNLRNIMSEERRRVNIIGTYVDVTSPDKAIAQIWQWAHKGDSRQCTYTTVHVCMEGHKNKWYQDIINNSDFVIPDGQILAWLQKLYGQKDAQRTTEPDTMAMMLDKANTDKMPIGLYGCSEEQLKELVEFITTRYPNINLVYHFSPPFRALTQEEDEKVIADINDSQCRILFVALGCPKQEKWISEHIGKVNSVMLSVGVSFNFISGKNKRAPKWIQSIGLEWLHRFFCEPKRLAYRYWVLNPWFLWLSFLQLTGLRKF